MKAATSNFEADKLIENVYNKFSEISNFFVAGINYKKTDATIRSLYAVNDEHYASILLGAKKSELTDLFVLSTCNRTEIYGFVEDAAQLYQILCDYTAGGIDTFKEIAYIKKGGEAIHHLFQVSAGLDSQILGDYEIVGQIKKAIKFSKEHHCIGGYMERLINSVLQASKEIKTTTALSGGTVSVSFAVVQYIREQFPVIAEKKIALIGVGKIGSNTCKNLVDYLNTRNIVLVNRTAEKATELAEELGIQFAPMEQLDEIIETSDIILVATNSSHPIITKKQLIGGDKKLIFDLSIPNNVETTVSTLHNIELVNVDALSKIKDSTLQKREYEIPKAMAIIDKFMQEFINWHQMRKNVPVLKAIKTKLEQMHNYNSFINYSIMYNDALLNKNDKRIQKVINSLAVKMKEQNQQGCYYLEALNDYIAIA